MIVILRLFFYIIILISCFTSSSLVAQPGPIGERPDVVKNKPFEVKQFGDFTARFNFDVTSEVINRIKKELPPIQINRKTLITSLFNFAQHWEVSEVEDFIAQITDKRPQTFITFSDPSWYIELECIFEYKGVSKKGSLILENEYDLVTDASKWVISGIKADFLAKDKTYPEFPVSKNSNTILSPMSHESYFGGLIRAFRDADNLRNYFTEREWNPELIALAHEIRKGNITIKKSTKLTYYLFQLDNWVVTLNEFSRNLPNSGLLISGLYRKTESEKQLFLKKQLNLY